MSEAVVPGARAPSVRARLRDRDLERAWGDEPEAPAGLASRILDRVRKAEAERGRVPELDLEATEHGIARVRFGGTGRTRAEGPAARRHAEQARAELAEFFAAERGYFTVPVDLSGARPFQRAVLASALRIPLGEVRSYRWIAAQAGSAQAVRAAGAALGTNPVPLLVPCHRVVRADGSLGGYLGGLPLKRWLLRLESEIPALVGRTSAREVCRAGCPRERGAPESDRVSFSSVAAARASGYRACATCRPDDGAPI